MGSGFNDDPAWLVLGVAAYIKESGDWSILDEQVQYENEPGTETPLYEHLQRSIQYTLDRLGPNNLPLIGRADWNDCLNLNCFSDTPGNPSRRPPTKMARWLRVCSSPGCSCWHARKWRGLLDITTIKQRWKEPQKAAAEMEKTVWAAGWDGEWFRRAYDDYGHVLGSKENTEGQIFIEPQGICVMAGLGCRKRQRGQSARFG